MDIKTAAKLAVGLLLLVTLIAAIGPARILEAVVTASPLFLLLAILIAPIPILLKFLIWHRITNITGKELPLSTTSAIYLIGSFFGMITPSKIGHLVKFRYLEQHGIGKVTALSMTLIERVFDMLVIAAFSIVGIVLISGGAGLFGFSLLVLGALFAALLAVVFSRRVFVRCGSLVLKTMAPLLAALGVGEEGRRLLAQAYTPMEELKHNTLALVWILLLSFLVWVFAGLTILLIARAFGSAMDILYAVAVVSIAGAVSLIPVTVSGIGTRDAAIVALFALIGIPTATALVSSLVYMFVENALPALAGGVVFAASGKGGKAHG